RAGARPRLRVGRPLARAHSRRARGDAGRFQSVQVRAHGEGAVSRALLRHVALPIMFLTVALLGGLRFAAPDLQMRFVAPPLVTLLLAVFLVTLFCRTRLVDLADWVGADRPPLENLSNALTLATGYAATVQIFNAILPEDTLFFTLFACFFALVF